MCSPLCLALVLCHRGSPWTQPVEGGVLTSVIHKRKQGLGELSAEVVQLELAEPDSKLTHWYCL